MPRRAWKDIARADLQAHVGRQCRAWSPRRRLLRLLRAALAAWADRPRLRICRRPGDGHRPYARADRRPADRRRLHHRRPADERGPERRRKPRGLRILLAFLVATYGGTNGATSVITALNIAYEEKEKRSLVLFYLLAVSMTVRRAAAGARRARRRRRRWLTSSTCCRKLRTALVIAGKVAGYALLTLVAAAIASTLYRFGPSREDAHWTWITPGSAVRRGRPGCC